MTTFKDYAENTKNDYIVIFFGMIIIACSTFGKSIMGVTICTIIKLIGVIVLTYAVFLYVLHLKIYFTENKDFLVNSKYAPYRQNIFAGCGVTIIIMVLLFYSAYTIFV